MGELSLVLSDRASRGYLIRKYLVNPGTNALSRAAYATLGRYGFARAHVSRPIFIVGCSRSGTTIVAEIFGGHPDVANFSEQGHIFEPRYYDPEIDHSKSETDATTYDKWRLHTWLSMYQRLRGRPRVTNKHPQNSLRIPYLLEIFPDALFVHVLRDGRHVVASHLAKTRRERFRAGFPFGNFPKPPRWREYLDLPPAEAYAHQWTDIVRLIRADTRSLDATQYVEVKYEDFCACPRDVLEVMDRFGGLEPGARSASETPEKLVQKTTYWGDALSPEERDAVSRIVEPCLGECDYY